MLEPIDKRVQFDCCDDFDVQFDCCDDFDVQFDNLTVIDKLVDVEIYEGDYTITPKSEQKQVLNTKDKYMIRDVVIKEVPYFETSNDYGNTVYIASEVE